MKVYINISKYLLHAHEAVIRGKFIALDAHLRKGERSQISDPSFYLKKVEKSK